MRTFSGFLLFLLVITGSTLAQTTEPTYNYDEAKVGTYTLPDPLVNQEGKRVATKAAWRTRRQEILHLFANNVYGQTPAKTVTLRFEPIEIDSSALDGRAIRKQVAIWLTDYPQLPPINVLIYSPQSAKKPVSAFLGLNFSGNHTVLADPAIRLPLGWVARTNDQKINNRATEADRGRAASSWSVDSLITHGYALVTAYYGDIEPDFPQGWWSGIRSVLGDTSRADNWGAVSAWAWGMSRILDYLQTDPLIDGKRVIAFGHSRIGKAALWAGAQDERFAGVVGNEAGEGGAALSRRWYGETVERINNHFPHWFSTHYKSYNNRVADLPVDQHELLALVAPRPLYIASADGDQWSDPGGEFLSAVQTDPIYKLFGKTGLGTTIFPALNQSIGQTVRYHIRSGKHDVTPYDWQQYLRFADALVR
jgi:hypothetical protein